MAGLLERGARGAAAAPVGGDLPAVPAGGHRAPPAPPRPGGVQENPEQSTAAHSRTRWASGPPNRSTASRAIVARLAVVVAPGRLTPPPSRSKRGAASG